MTDEQFNQIVQRLNILVKVVVAQHLADCSSLTEKSVLLDGLGFTTAEIAHLLGKPSKDVAATLRMYRKRKMHKTVPNSNLRK